MPRITINPPYYPIIYIRGYAGSDDAVEETVATPYMGFNLGSTKVRQRWNKTLVRYIFESPLIRLMKDHDYEDVYVAGRDLPSNQQIPPTSVIIYRYYDEVSREFNPDAVRPDIQEYARGLNTLINKVRDRVCGDDAQARADFKVYLVAHSMGGLISRCFLQNEDVGDDGNRRAVDKVFTYATPHNGIDFRVLGNVPSFFSRNNVDNFNVEKMAGYLKLPSSDRVNTLQRKFPQERFFCLVGTNHKDYDAVRGWSRRLVGPMSDGLVLIRNSTVDHAPRAFVHRSHSGDYGIVNSEEGYQNLSRFLFGDVRVDGILEVEAITLPPDVEAKKKEGREVRASYNFEVVVRTRGARYDLHRRTADEGSAILRMYDELIHPDRVNLAKPRHPHLFSVFLSEMRRTKSRGALVFSVDINVLVPEYEVDGFLFLDDHFEGSYLYRDTITLAATPPSGNETDWTVRYGYDSRTPGRATREADVVAQEGEAVWKVPVESKTRPGMKATLNLVARPWQ